MKPRRDLTQFLDSLILRHRCIPYNEASSKKLSDTFGKDD